MFVSLIICYTYITHTGVYVLWWPWKDMTQINIMLLKDRLSGYIDN